jgi:hypothetical protein
MPTFKHSFFGRLAAYWALTCLFAAFTVHANAQTLATGQIDANTYGTSVTLLNTELAPTLVVPPFTVSLGGVLSGCTQLPQVQLNRDGIDVRLITLTNGSSPISAGWGDIITGLAAIPLAAAAGGRGKLPRWLLTAWTAFGMLDLILAITLGALSAPGTPFRAFYRSPRHRLNGDASVGRNSAIACTALPDDTSNDRGAPANRGSDAGHSVWPV